MNFYRYYINLALHAIPPIIHAHTDIKSYPLLIIPERLAIEIHVDPLTVH